MTRSSCAGRPHREARSWCASSPVSWRGTAAAPYPRIDSGPARAQPRSRARTQDHDLLRRQTGREHQPVEIVILDFADEDAPECLLEYRMQRIDLDLDIGNSGLHAQIVHPD